MRTKTALTILLLFAATGFAQDPMADTLRKGIVEEDSTQNPGAAIQDYTAVMTQYAAARQTAATALFRMAECYRKQGNRSQAIASYQRILKDFADQTKLATESRTILATTYSADATGGNSDKAQFDQLITAQKKGQDNIREARAQYRATIQQQIALIQKQISLSDERYKDKAGQEGVIIELNLRLKLVQLKRDLAAFDAGLSATASR